MPILCRSSLSLNTLTNGASTTSCGSPFHTLGVLTVRKCIQIGPWFPELGSIEAHPALFCRGKQASTHLCVTPPQPINPSGIPHGFSQVVLISPAEIAKVRLQTQKEPSCVLFTRPKYRGAVHCLQMIAKEEGLRGLYKGSLALLCRDCHSVATYFLSYSALRRQFTRASDLWAVLLSGGCAGVLGWATATPMDVIKSRMQADGEGQRKYSGLIHCARDSIREEGVRVLFKGLGLNSIRAFPANMVVFFIYEAVLRLGECSMR
uniref:Solute carrier family 25 member 47 n=1 Tax=Varanus komodoensis TaxID=61221 RepID=A0A8D2KTL7_VARKO